jgi:hypothetical protein
MNAPCPASAPPDGPNGGPSLAVVVAGVRYELADQHPDGLWVISHRPSAPTRSLSSVHDE